jgi:hypothetical protein
MLPVFVSLIKFRPNIRHWFFFIRRMSGQFNICAVHHHPKNAMFLVQTANPLGPEVG